MKSTLENISNLEKKLNIEIPMDQVNDEFLKAYKYLQKEVDLKGFRKGKAPIDRIRSIYQERVSSDVQQNVIQTGFTEAIKEHSLNPVSAPKIDSPQLQEDASFAFSVQFEIRPEVSIKTKSGFTVEKEKLQISDERVDETIKNIQENQATYEPVKLIRPLKEGDFAMIDFEGFVDDKPLDNGSAKGHMLEIGANQFIPGFEEALVGMQKDEEKSVALKFPEDYHVDELKAKPVIFKVKLNDIKTKTLPELNEEFFKKIQQDSLEGLKKQIREDIEKSEGQRIDTELKDKVMKAFVEANPVEVPQTLFQEQRQALVTDFQNRLKQQGFTDDNFDEYQKKWNTDFDETASFMVQAAFLVEQLAEDENLKATAKDIDAKIEEMAQQVGMEKEKIMAFYQENNRLGQMQYQITEENVYKHLLAQSTVNEVEKAPEAESTEG